jgi:hypothetical protein
VFDGFPRNPTDRQKVVGAWARYEPQRSSEPEPATGIHHVPKLVHRRECQQHDILAVRRGQRIGCQRGDISANAGGKARRVRALYHADFGFADRTRKHKSSDVFGDKCTQQRFAIRGAAEALRQTTPDVVLVERR